MLTVDGVAKSFGKHVVLRGASLEAEAGTVTGIEGENGAGKTTLLRIIIGLLKPDAGRVVIHGKPGYCPQEATVFDTLSVSENFRYFAKAYGLSAEGPAGWERRKDGFLERLRFRDYEEMLVSELSGGTRQKLNLSLALLHNPDLLILDEPYSGFDWETYLHFWELTEELREAGKSLLIISHFVYDRSRFDTLLKLEDGVLKRGRGDS